MKVKKTLKDGTVKVYIYDKKYPRTKKSMLVIPMK